MVRRTDSVSGQPSSSKPAQRVSDPSPDHSPTRSDDGTALPAGDALLDRGPDARRPSPTRWATTSRATIAATATGSPTITHGVRPDRGRPVDSGDLHGPPPYGSVTGSPPEHGATIRRPATNVRPPGRGSHPEPGRDPASGRLRPPTSSRSGAEAPREHQPSRRTSAVGSTPEPVVR